MQSGRDLKYYLDFNKSFNVLKDIGIFTSKYDARTSWDLAELSETAKPEVETPSEEDSQSEESISLDQVSEAEDQISETSSEDNENN